MKAEYLTVLDKLVAKYEQRRAALLPVLHYVQEQEGLITPALEEDVARYIGIPVVQVHQVVCFYHLFHQERKGKCHFSVCETTACALLGAEDIIGPIEPRFTRAPIRAAYRVSHNTLIPADKPIDRISDPLQLMATTT